MSNKNVEKRLLRGSKMLVRVSKKLNALNEQITDFISDEELRLDVLPDFEEKYSGLVNDLNELSKIVVNLEDSCDSLYALGKFWGK